MAYFRRSWTDLDDQRPETSLIYAHEQHMLSTRVFGVGRIRLFACLLQINSNVSRREVYNSSMRGPLLLTALEGHIFGVPGRIRTI